MKRISIYLLFFLCTVGTAAEAQTKILARRRAYEIPLRRNRITVAAVNKKPTLKIRMWDEDEVWLKYPHEATLSSDGKKVSATNMDWVQTSPDILRWLFYFKTKPITNSYTLELGGNWQDFDFFYQTPVKNPEYFIGEDGEEWIRQTEASGYSERPRSVDGSYAVYHKTKRDYILGQKNYGCGKAFHIYVPKATDAEGTFAWCSLWIDAETGLYQVTIPQKFLDEAVYPVKVNDTFGTTSVGSAGYTGQIATNTDGFDCGAASSSGTVTALWVYDSDSSNASGLRVALYDVTSSTPVNLIWSSEALTPAGSGWLEVAVTGTNLVSSGSEYAIAVQANASSDFRVQYDLVSDWFSSRTSDAYSGGMPDPWGTVTSSSGNKRHSVYVVFTASGSSTPSQVIMFSCLPPILVIGIILTFSFIATSTFDTTTERMSGEFNGQRRTDQE